MCGYTYFRGVRLFDPKFDPPILFGISYDFVLRGTNNISTLLENIIDIRPTTFDLFIKVKLTKIWGKSISLASIMLNIAYRDYDCIISLWEINMSIKMAAFNLTFPDLGRSK